MPLLFLLLQNQNSFDYYRYKGKVSALDFIDKNLNEDLFRLRIKECIEYLTTIPNWK